MKSSRNKHFSARGAATRPAGLRALAAALAFIAAVFFASPAFAAPQQSKYFGFYEVEFYKGSNMAQSLKHADVNSDGAVDITFLDVEKSQIAVLLNSPSGASSAETELNAIRYDDRFVRHNVSLERKVYDYEFLALAGDTLESLAVIAEPCWLVIYRQGENMQFYEYSRTQLDEANYSKARAACRDFDGDGIRDLLVMCPDFFVLVANSRPAEFGRNARYIPAGSEYGSEPSGFDVFDINSDGYNDLVYYYSSKTANLRVRFGSAGGGAFLDEEAYDLLNFRCMGLFKAPPSGPGGTAGNALGCVLETSNQLAAYRIKAGPSGPKDRNVRLSTVYFNKDDGGQKSPVMLHDFNSDGAVDAAVANPELGRLGVYLYSADNRLKSYASFPFATGITGAFAAGSAKKGVTNVIAYSKDRLLKASVDSGGMKYEFCRPVETFERAFFAAPFRTAAGAEKIAVLSRESGEVSLREADCDLSGAAPASRVDHRLEGVTGLKISCSSDEITFFMAYFKYDAPKPFFRCADGVFRPGAFADGAQAAAMNANNTAVCDFDSDGSAEVLFGEKNTVKIYALDAAGRRVVQKDQINAGAPDFECESLFAAPGMARAYDPESKRLFEYDRAARSEKMSSVEKKFAGSSLADLNGRPAFISAACAGAVIDSPSLAFEKYGFAEYEEIKNGRYNNLLAKDINGDGAADLVLTCGAQNYLDIFNFIGGAWKLSLRFKIFNTRQFSQYSSYTSEPQAIDSADFDGDGYNDLAMLVHNKVIVYYSDSPRGALGPSKKGGK